jgi:hypothetical protein
MEFNMSRSLTNLPASVQRVVHHLADYTITEEDKAEIRSGTALWFLGSVMAKLLLIFRMFPTTEFFVFLVARKEDPYVIEEVIIPEQFANSAAVLTPGRAVLRAGREARTRGGIIVAAAHSHAAMPVFSSSLDVEFMRQLSDEAAGWSSSQSFGAKGRVAVPLPVSNGDPATLPRFEVTFPERPGLSVRITSGRSDLSVDDLAVSLTYDEPTHVSAFLTFNAAGDRFMPLFKVTRCPFCNGTTHEEATSAVAIHVIGPEVLGQRERRETLAAAERHTPHHSVPSHLTYGSKKFSSWQPTDYVDQHASTSGTSTAFVVSRHGQSRRVAAEVLEEAAYLSPRLAEALGWQDDAVAAECLSDSAVEPVDLPGSNGTSQENES